MKSRGLGVAVTLISSFTAWIYCIAVVVLGLIYQAYPRQEHVAILISTLPHHHDDDSGVCFHRYSESV